MKEQYVGDISDYRKYALLRALSTGGANRIGVAWMLTPSDSSTDGSKLAYLKQPERYRHFDPELFDILAHVAAEPDRRRLHSIEGASAIPGACYFNAPLSDKVAEREAYMAACLTAFAGVDLVFFDPDNGLEIKGLPVGRKTSSKFLYLDEVQRFFYAGLSILIYQHFARVERGVFIAACGARLRAVAPEASIWTFRTKDVVFLLLLQPSASVQLRAAVQAASTRWGASFISGLALAPVEEPIHAGDAADGNAGTSDTADQDGMPGADPGNGAASMPPVDEVTPVLPTEPPPHDLHESSPPRPSLMRRILARLR